MVLAMVAEGKEVIVEEIMGGWGIRNRLSGLGIYEGTKVRVIKNDIYGPLIIGVLDSTIAIGRGQAHKIMVEVL